MSKRKPILIWTTDWHLQLSTIDSVNSHARQLIDLSDKIKCNHIFIGGDIFDSRKGQPQIVLNTFHNILDHFSAKGINVTAIPGNHDKTDYTSEESFLIPFKHHSRFTLIENYDQFIGGENTMFHAIPFFDEKLTYQDYLSRVKISNDYKFNFLLTHIAVNGVLNNDGTSVENDLDVAKFKSFTKVLVGHYHNAQSDGNIVYTGSAYQANFGEDDMKGATVIYDDGATEFIEFDFPKFNTIKVDIDDLTPELIQDIVESKKNDNVKVKISGDKLKVNKYEKGILEQSGIKVDIVQEDSIISPDVAISHYREFDNNEIIDKFDDWCKEKKPKNLKYGKEMLIKNLK